MHKAISTHQAPKAVGPYSQAVLAKDFLFISGQLPINPASSLIEALTIEEQTTQVLKNIEAILREAGLNFHQVVRCEIFLTNMNDFKTVNAIYANTFNGPVKPARQTIEVSDLPMGALIEISCIALTGK